MSLDRVDCGLPVLSTVIVGSFRKHLDQIGELRQRLCALGIQVLAPGNDAALNPGDEFIFFESDPVRNPKLLQDGVFAKIRQASFVTAANIDGYFGRAAILEVGYALASGVPVYSIEPVEDPHLGPYCTFIAEVLPGFELASQR